MTKMLKLYYVYIKKLTKSGFTLFSTIISQLENETKQLQLVHFKICSIEKKTCLFNNCYISTCLLSTDFPW